MIFPKVCLVGSTKPHPHPAQGWMTEPPRSALSPRRLRRAAAALWRLPPAASAGKPVELSLSCRSQVRGSLRTSAAPRRSSAQARRHRRSLVCSVQMLRTSASRGRLGPCFKYCTVSRASYSAVNLRLAICVCGSLLNKPSLCLRASVICISGALYSTSLEPVFSSLLPLSLGFWE